MKKIICLLLILSLSSLLGCSEDKKPEDDLKTGVDLVAIGAVNFGGVLINESRSAAIRVYNHGPDAIDTSSWNSLLLPPFSVTSIASPCNSGSLPVGQNCVVSIRFAPTQAGIFTSTFSIEGKSIFPSGKGLLGGVISISESSWTHISHIAGTEIEKEFFITNEGDYSVATPTISNNNGLSISQNLCGAFISGQTTCKMTLRLKRLIAGPVNEIITFSSGAAGNIPVNLITEVLPSFPSGVIELNNPPNKIIANGVDEKIITTKAIKDSYGNIVADGTEIFFNVSGGLSIVGASSATTINGIVSATVRSDTVKGPSLLSFSDLVSNAYGSLPLNKVSGPAVGPILVGSYASTVVANGSAQVMFQTEPLLDAFGNIVENGEEVFFFMNGTGLLNTVSALTFNGRVNVLLTAPTIIGSSELQIRSNPIRDINNIIIGYEASGNFPINYIPGPPAGNIPIVSQFPAIYAIEDPIYVDSETEIRSDITIGPVRDAFNNIVGAGQEVEVAISNGNNALNSINPVVLTTNGSGMVDLIVSGNGNRGAITITATTTTGALGTHSIWAYKDDRITVSETESPLKMYEKIHNALTLPNINDRFADVGYDYLSLENVDIFNQFGRTAGFKRYHATPFPFGMNSFMYYAWDCMVPGNNGWIYVAPCLQQDSMTNPLINMEPQMISGTSGGFNTPFSNVFPIPTDRPYTTSHTFVSGDQRFQWKEPLIGFLKTLDRFLLFGSYRIDNDLNFLDSRLSTFYTGLRRNTSPSAPFTLTSTNQTGNESSEIIGEYPFSGLSLGKFVEGDNNKLYNFGSLSFSSGTMNNSVIVYNGNNNSWASLQATADSNERVSGEPQPRYQNGLTYVKELNSLFVIGGLREYSCDEFLTKNSCNKYEQCSWDDIAASSEGDTNTLVGEFCNGISNEVCSLLPNNTECSKRAGCQWTGLACTLRSGLVAEGRGIMDAEDIWKLDISTSAWKKICGSEEPFIQNTSIPNPAFATCGLPQDSTPGRNSIHPDVYTLSELAPVQMVRPNYVNAIWNKIRQKIYIYYPEMAHVLTFDPYTESITPTNDGMESLAGNSQIFYDEFLSRTFAYKKENPSSVPNSDLYSFDLRSDEKIYYKFDIELGSGAKVNARSIEPKIVGYGIGGSSNGIEVYIYNYATSDWEFLGENTAINDTQALSQQISQIYPYPSDYISVSGRVSLLITSKGVPSLSDESETVLDAVFIDGRF